MIFFCFSSTLFSATTQIPQTGQTKCYDASGAEVSCAGTGQDGEFKAGVAWPVSRFTVGTGAESDCITDNLTGLMWAKRANAPGDCTTWETALAFTQDTFEGCGYTDWRLSNRSEMRSLIDYSQSNPALMLGHPFVNSLTDDNSYWSSTSTVTLYSVLFNWGVARQEMSIFLGIFDTDWVVYGIHKIWPVQTAEALPDVPDIELSLASHDFGGVNVGFTASQELRISNAGTANLTVTGVAFDGPDKTMFNINSGGSNPCTSYTPTIAPGGNCTIMMTFTPGSAGAKSATMQISSNDPDENPKNVALSGTGVAIDQPDIDVNPTFHNFESVNVGSSASQQFTISNTGGAVLNVTSITMAGEYGSLYVPTSGGTNPCGSLAPSIAAGGSCTFLVTFTPDSAGSKPTTMLIASNDPDLNPAGIALGGTGVVVSQPDITISPAPPIIMENAYVDSYSDKTIEVRNDGSADLILGTIDGPGAPFSRLPGGTCTNGTTIIPGGSCTIMIRFTPPAARSYISAFYITSNDPDESPLEVDGVGLNPPVYPDIDVSPDSHNFGSVNVGSFATQAFTISNTGTGDLVLVFPVYVTGGDEAMFSVVTGGTNPCASLQPTIPAGGSCTVSVTFSPTSAGAKSSTLRFQSNDLDEPTKDIPLSGTGVTVPDIDVAPPSHRFGSVRVGSSANQQFTISNAGTGPLNVTGIMMTGGDAGMFSVASGGTNPCGSLAPTIAAGGSCTVIATFTPTSAGAKSTTMRIVSDDPDENPKDVPLNGTGISFTVTPSEGTYGTEVLIEGNEFGSKKGKVLIGSVALKVQEWTATRIKGTLNKAMTPEAYNVTIQRKDPKGATPLIEEDAFTVKRPEIDEVLPDGGKAGDEIKITGWFFGTKKGKVYIGTRSCKIVSWTMITTSGASEIKFIVPKNLSPGPQELKVVNSVGQDTASFTVE